MDCEKGALVFTTFAYHMHAVTIAMEGFALFYWGRNDYNNGKGNDKDDKHDNGNHHSDYESRDDAIKAFLIIAFLLYLFAFLIQVIMKTGEDLKLSKKIMGIILFIVLIIAVLSVWVALGIYGDTFGKNTPPYPTSTYVLASFCGIAAAVCIILSACCGK